MAEPEWDEEQQGWMLALHQLEAEECSRCGGDLTETTDPANEFAYRVPPPARCHRCTAIGVKQHSDEYKDTRQMQALLWTAVRKT